MTQITVGIPTMNNESTIRATLESLLNQTRLPDRIIVVDASDDKTPEIIRKLDREHETPIDIYIQSSDGRGVGKARQEIYQRFDGDVLACLDTGLVVDEDWLELREEFHLQNPSYDILSGTDQSKVDRPVSDKDSPHYFRQQNCSITKTALDNVQGWDPWMPRGEDWDMHIRLASSGAEAYVKSDLSSERIEDENGVEIVKKNLSRPSSILFIRKYGLSYLSFHPLHLAGELASTISFFGLISGIVLLLFGSRFFILPLVIPVLGVSTYLYIRRIKFREGVRVTVDDWAWAVTFLFLWVSVLRELRRPPIHDWNYGGFEGFHR